MNMHMKPFDHDELLKLDGDVPLVRSVPYGIQHALAMFVANLVLPRDMEVKVAASDSSAGSADDADGRATGRIQLPASRRCDGQRAAAWRGLFRCDTGFCAGFG